MQPTDLHDSICLPSRPREWATYCDALVSEIGYTADDLEVCAYM